MRLIWLITGGRLRQLGGEIAKSYFYCMKKHPFSLALITALFLNACNQPTGTNDSVTASKTDSATIIPNSIDTAVANAALPKTPADFVPAGYTIFETVNGDLDNDQLPDCILIIKGTDKSKFVKDENRGMLDRNRRGIMVLLNKNNHYEQLVKNYECFSSENEDGGVYYAPELDLEVNKGKLLVNYRHGRYGYWSYTFRIKGNDMELIGYDATSSTGPVINEETSINFLTKRKQTRENIKPEAEPGEEEFKESWADIKLKAPILLSAIKDFDELEMYKY